MSPVLVLGTVRCIAERLCAAGELAGVGFLARVGPQVCLEILQPGVRLQAVLKLKQENILSITNTKDFIEELTVHLCGFSPVCLLMCTTSMYCALNGFCSLEQPIHWHTKDFLLAPMWSMFRC